MTVTYPKRSIFKKIKEYQYTPFGVEIKIINGNIIVPLKLKQYILLFIFYIFGGVLKGQNVENIKNIKQITKKKPIEFGGNLNIGAGFYHSNAAIKRVAPYNWFISGSPFIKLYGLNIPFTFTYSETGRSLTHPFHYNFTGASPYYKWATAHIGFRSMSFSEYTVSGVVFNGIGVELKPNKLRLGAFYGVFNPAIEVDSTNANFGVILPAYKRVGYGAKIGFGTDNNYFDLIYFRGKDDAKSLKEIPSFETIKPADNVTFGPRFKFTFFKRWFLESDLAISAFTRNVLNDTLKETNDLKTIYQFIRVNTTSYAAFAGHIASGINFNKWGVNIRLRQVSSDFQSMGINLLQDDIREYTVNPNVSLIKGKINISGSYGFYTDNISKKRLNTTQRSIYNTNVGINASSRLNMSFGYSNFGTTRNNGQVQMNDSITFSIINESYNGNLNYRFGSAKKPFILSLFTQIQEAKDRNIFTRKYNNSNVLNAGLNGQYSLPKSKLQISGGLAYANFVAGGQAFTTYNAQTSFRKPFLKNKLTTSVAFSYAQRFNESLKQGEVFSINTGIQAKLGKQHSIQTQYRIMRNTTGIVSNSAFNEQRISIQYGFIF